MCRHDSVGVLGKKGRLSTLRQDKKHTPALCASLPISFRTSLHVQPCPRPLDAPLCYAGCHGFSLPLVAAVQPCNVSWHSPPALPLLRYVPTASLISCGLLRYTTTLSFATSLRCAYGSFSRALPCPQGFLIVHVRHPAGPLRLRLRLCLPAVEMHIIATCWVQVFPTGGRQAIKNLALRRTVWCFPVRTSQSQPQPAVGYGAWWRILDRHLRLWFSTLRLLGFGVCLHFACSFQLLLGFWHSIPLCSMPCHSPDLRLLSSLLAMVIGQCLSRHSPLVFHQLSIFAH